MTSTIADEAVGVGERTRRAEVAVRRAQPVAARADVAVILMVEGEGGALEGLVAAGGLVEHRYVRLNAPVLDQPGKVGRGAVCGIGDELLRPQTEAFLRVRSIIRGWVVTSACRIAVVASTSTITA